jgi:hypothetical protein
MGFVVEKVTQRLDFLFSINVCPVWHFTNAPYSYIHLPMILRKLGSYSIIE